MAPSDACQQFCFHAFFPIANTALGSDGQGPQGFSFVFLDLFDFFDFFADLARACLGFLERPSRSCEVVRVRMDCTIGQRPH